MQIHKSMQREVAKQLILGCKVIYVEVFGPDHSKKTGAAQRARDCTSPAGLMQIHKSIPYLSMKLHTQIHSQCGPHTFTICPSLSITGTRDHADSLDVSAVTE